MATRTNASTPAAASPRRPGRPTPRPRMVEMTGSTFAPERVDLKVGETVTFVNQDEIAHTATAEGTFDSGTLRQGDRFDFTATKAGTIHYVCSFHPGMAGTINVT